MFVDVLNVVFQIGIEDLHDGRSVTQTFFVKEDFEDVSHVRVP
jgi:hypothetical protein